MVEDEVAGFLFKEKPLRALFAIQNLEDNKAYGSNIGKYIDSTYAHTTDILKTLEELSLVESKKDGRKRMYRLRESGSELVEQLRPVVGDAWNGTGTVGMEVEESEPQLQGQYDAGENNE